MSKAKITLIGLNNYCVAKGYSLFDRVSIPKGIDRDMLIHAILLRAGDFEVLYPNPEFMKDVIDSLFMRWYRTFEKWVNALNIEYDPLSNYDRKEEWTDNSKADASTSSASKSDDTLKVSAYDSDMMHDKEKTSANNSSSITSKSNANNKRTGRAYGNIGVTTSQQMLDAELTIARFNLYNQIADIIVRDICIMVY